MGWDCLGHMFNFLSNLSLHEFRSESNGLIQTKCVKERIKMFHYKLFLLSTSVSHGYTNVWSFLK